MSSRNKTFIAVLLLSLLTALLFGCTEAPIIDPNADILEITQVVTADDIAQLDQYKNLETADLRGSSCYEQILDYIEAHPDVDVRYDVEICSSRCENTAVSLEILPCETDAEDLMEKLVYLPSVKEVSLPDTVLSLQQIDALKEAYPHVLFSYTVVIADCKFSPEDTSLDLSGLTAEQVDEAIGKLDLLPGAAEANLMKADGTCSLSIQDVKKLQDAAPRIFFHYSFDLFGKTVSTADEVIEYDEVNIGNEGETAIRDALDILKNCRYIKFDDCGIDSTVMAGIRDDYPDVKVVWRIHVGKYSLLTDETMMRLTFVLENDNVSELKYCTDIVYMDVGHNDWLSDFSFISYMPNLECAIVSGSCINDLSVFENCRNLVWLEMCYCGHTKDLSPLKGLKNLKYLNISYTSISDVTPLDEAPLERFVCLGIGLSGEERNAFTEKHPECLFVYKGRQPFGYGWRYNDQGSTYFEYYANMREIFRYADKDFTGNTKEK